MQLGRIAVVGLVAGVLAMVLGVALPGMRVSVYNSAVLVIGVVVVVELMLSARRRRLERPTPFERALVRVDESVDRPADLERLERALGWRSYSRRDFDHRVRPVLLRLVRYRLLAARGIDLEREPERARGLLPNEIGGLLDAPSEEITPHHADTRSIAGLLDHIESIS